MLFVSPRLQSLEGIQISVCTHDQPAGKKVTIKLRILTVVYRHNNNNKKQSEIQSSI